SRRIAPMDTFLVRELAAPDVADAGRVLGGAYPQRAHQVRSLPTPAAHERPRRWVAVAPAAATVAGYAALWHVRQQKYRCDVVVDPEWRRRGAGTRLFDVMLGEAARAGARTVQAPWYDTSRQVTEVLERPTG